MQPLAIVFLSVLLGACANPARFVADAPPVPVTSRTPDHFELPARFALARLVYGRAQPAGTKEQALWEDLAERSEGLGSFAPLVLADPNSWQVDGASLIKAAREQRYNYLLMIDMDPETGSSDVVLYHTGSGGVMATGQAVAPGGGQNGFWGNQINNPARLERLTLKIAKAVIPTVEQILQGALDRQR